MSYFAHIGPLARGYAPADSRWCQGSCFFGAALLSGTTVATWLPPDLRRGDITTTGRLFIISGGWKPDPWP
jgi:hypothetical protein